MHIVKSDKCSTLVHDFLALTIYMTVKGGVIMDRRGGCERSGVALQNWTTRRLL